MALLYFRVRNKCLGDRNGELRIMRLKEVITSQMEQPRFVTSLSEYIHD
jgi:hypothetical protein